MLAPVVKHVLSPITSQGQNILPLSESKKIDEEQEVRQQGGSKAIEAADINGKKSKSGRVMTGENELKEKKNHRITELVMLEETAGGHLDQFPRPGGVTQSRLPRWLFSV